MTTNFPQPTDILPGIEVGEVLIRGVDLHLDFGQTQAVRGVDVTVREGEILAVMGPSGSGKSSLLHLLAGILQPTAGQVTYRGREISQLDEASRARLRLDEFGFIFQYGQLLPDLSAIDNVSVPLLLQGVGRKAALHQAADWLDRLGLEAEHHKQPSDLSGGQAQRVAIARALVASPSVVFADEPTGSLDSLSSETVMELLTDLARNAGTTVVVITHDPRTAAYADREIIIRDGKVSADLYAGNVR